MSIIYAHGHGDLFNSPANKVASSAAAAWTVIGADATDRTIMVTGIGWSGAITGDRGELQIRDKDNDVFYHVTSGSYPNVDMLETALPVMAPLSYYDEDGGASIIVYGTYA